MRLVCAALLLAARFVPFSALPFVCPFKTVTGVACATCGMTRAWVHEAHGDVLLGFAQSPFGALLFFAALFAVLFGVPRLPRSVLAAGVVLLILNWFYVVQTGVA